MLFVAEDVLTLVVLLYSGTLGTPLRSSVMPQPCVTPDPDKCMPREMWVARESDDAHIYLAPGMIPVTNTCLNIHCLLCYFGNLTPASSQLLNVHDRLPTDPPQFHGTGRLCRGNNARPSFTDCLSFRQNRIH